MPPLEEIKQRIPGFCGSHGIQRLEVFGSVARGDEHPGSDVDLLVTFLPGVRPGLEFFEMQDELEQLLGRRVDLLTRRSVEQDLNPIRRHSILDSARDIYAAEASRIPS